MVEIGIVGRLIRKHVSRFEIFFSTVSTAHPEFHRFHRFPKFHRLVHALNGGNGNRESINTKNVFQN